MQIEPGKCFDERRSGFLRSWSRHVHTRKASAVRKWPVSLKAALRFEMRSYNKCVRRLDFYLEHSTSRVTDSRLLSDKSSTKWASSGPERQLIFRCNNVQLVEGKSKEFVSMWLIVIDLRIWDSRFKSSDLFSFFKVEQLRQKQLFHPGNSKSQKRWDDRLYLIIMKWCECQSLTTKNYLSCDKIQKQDIQ